MIRSAALVVSGLLALVVLDIPAAGQASAEYGMGAGKAAGTTGGLSGLWNTVTGALGVNSAKSSSTATPAASAPTTPKAAPSRPATRSKAKPKAGAKPSTAGRTAPVAAPAPPRPTYEDPHQIQAGMTYEEIIRRFGPPSLEFTNGPASKTLSYIRKGSAVQVTCQDGKVTSIGAPPQGS